MSITKAFDSVNSAPIGAQSAPTDTTTGPKARNHKSRVKLAYTTIWALEDILGAAQEGRTHMQNILNWVKVERLEAKGRYDVARLARLGELDGMIAQLALNVSELERLAADARIGLYTKRRIIDAKQ